jgi:hypothetical protein
MRIFSQILNNQGDHLLVSILLNVSEDFSREISEVKRLDGRDAPMRQGIF